MGISLLFKFVLFFQILSVVIIYCFLLTYSIQLFTVENLNALINQELFKFSHIVIQTGYNFGSLQFIYEKIEHVLVTYNCVLKRSKIQVFTDKKKKLSQA